MGIPTPSPTKRPAGVPSDSFGGHDLYPVAEAPQAYPWGRPIGDLIIPLVCTPTCGVWMIDGRFFIGVKGIGGVRLHAGLTRDGWICPNGSRWPGAPMLVIAAAAVVRCLLADGAAPCAGNVEAQECIAAAQVASDTASDMIRGVAHV